MLRLSEHPFLAKLRFAFQTEEHIHFVMDYYGEMRRSTSIIESQMHIHTRRSSTSVLSHKTCKHIYFVMGLLWCTGTIGGAVGAIGYLVAVGCYRILQDTTA